MNTARYLSGTRGRSVVDRSAVARVGADATGGPPVDACGFGPGGEMYTDAKGHAWMMICTPGGAVGVSKDANAELMGRDRSDLIDKIDSLAHGRGYVTLALIIVGIGGALWWFLKEIKP